MSCARRVPGWERLGVGGSLTVWWRCVERAGQSLSVLPLARLVVNEPRCQQSAQQVTAGAWRRVSDSARLWGREITQGPGASG